MNIVQMQLDFHMRLNEMIETVERMQDEMRNNPEFYSEKGIDCLDDMISSLNDADSALDDCEEVMYMVEEDEEDE